MNDNFFLTFFFKIEKRTQLKYKKERIGPWTWILPILLCLIACGFGTLANFHPKLEMMREPKGNKLIWKYKMKIMFFVLGVTINDFSSLIRQKK